MPDTSAQTAEPGRLQRWVESPTFSYAIIAVIVVNAITLGLETWPLAMANFGSLLTTIDRLALWIFTVELCLKFTIYRRRFFRDSWNIFDFTIVALAWLPAAGPLAVLRALRIMRVLRLLSVVPQMRAVVGALFRALPGMGSIVAVLLLVFYIAAVMATQLFGAEFPHWFGSIGASMYSLFQIMTLESWSMGIVRPVMEEHPYAWAFFVPFIVATSFTVLNLFIALIVNSMQIQTNDNVRAEAAIAHEEREVLMRSMATLTEEVRQMRKTVHRE